MKWVTSLVLVFIIVIVALSTIALSLPRRTTHARAVQVRQPPERVFVLLAEMQHMAQWNRNTAKVELLPPIDGNEVTRQTFKDGMVMTVITTESASPRRLVRSLGDERAPFSGSWSYKITAKPGGGSEVELTEVSEISNPVYRLLLKAAGPTKYMDQHLEDLNKELERVAPAKEATQLD